MWASDPQSSITVEFAQGIAGALIVALAECVLIPITYLKWLNHPLGDSPIHRRMQRYLVGTHHFSPAAVCRSCDLGELGRILVGCTSQKRESCVNSIVAIGPASY